MGTMADTAISVVDHLRSQGRRVGCLHVTVLPTLPRRGDRVCLSRRRRGRRRGARRRAAAADNPLTREMKAALYDHAGGTGAPDRSS